MEGVDVPPLGADQSRGPAVIAVLSLFFGLSTIMVFLRSVTRIWITRNFGWDDVTMALTQVKTKTALPAIGTQLTTGQAINAAGVGFTVTEIYNGFGRHRYYVSPDKFRMYRRMDYLHWAQLFIILPLCKVSICQFLLRLSTFKKTRLRTSLFALIGFLFITHVPFIIVILVQCRPAHRYWDLNASGECFTTDRVVDIIISQGGKFSARSQIHNLPRIDCDSIFDSYRLRPRCLACGYRLECADKHTDQDFSVFSDGSGCNVRLLRPRRASWKLLTALCDLVLPLLASQGHRFRGSSSPKT